MIILGIDPGARHCGWCRLTPATIDCGLTTAEEPYDHAREILDVVGHADLLVVERPQVYPGRLQKGDPNDLIHLAIIVGAMLGAIPHRNSLLPLPARWKGQVPKHIHHARLEARLEHHWSRVLRKSGLWAQSLRHNVLDAVGLAVWGQDQMQGRDA